jgi:hypothetical protein
MHVKLTALHNWKVEDRDGEIGVIVDVLFDDATWQARYLVVDDGGLAQRELFLPPSWVHRPTGEIGLLRADATREQVEAQTADGDDLRSARELLGCRVEATDGEAGELDDVAIDEQLWSIPHVLIDAHRWWPGGRALVDTAAVDGIDWGDNVVRLRLTRDQVRHAPAAD